MCSVAIEKLEKSLAGLHYKEESLTEKFENLDTKAYFGASIDEEIVDLLFKEL